MSEDKKITPGMNTDAIATLLALSEPPVRQVGEGINVPEYAKKARLTKHKAREKLYKRKDLLPVLMTGYNGRDTIVFLPKEDAENNYPDWILEKPS
jgi:hypothetical protein